MVGSDDRPTPPPPAAAPIVERDPIVSVKQATAPLGDAHDRRADEEAERAHQGHAKYRIVRMNRGAGRCPRLRLLHRDGPVRGHEHVVEDDVLAARGGEAGDMPVVLDAVVGARHEVHDWLDRTRAQLAHRSDDGPLRVVDTGHVRPFAAQSVAAAGRFRASRRPQDRRDDRVGVAPPDLLLGLARVHPDHPGLQHDVGVDPRGRRAAGAELLGNDDIVGEFSVMASIGA
ncbi:MAG TPA: hypothetical protein VF274_09780, partial [Alphaproteobacteria bacterium]